MIAVIGCGNLNRRDDGVGSTVVNTLHADPRLAAAPDLKLFDAATDGLAVMFKARGCDELIIIDACRSGQPPGAIFEVPGEEFGDDVEVPRDSHALRWDHALTIGRRLYVDAFPRRVTVFLIEVQDTGFGLELSEPVCRAATDLVERMSRRLLGGAA